MPARCWRNISAISAPCGRNAGARNANGVQRQSPGSRSAPWVRVHKTKGTPTGFNTALRNRVVEPRWGTLCSCAAIPRVRFATLGCDVQPRCGWIPGGHVTGDAHVFVYAWCTPTPAQGRRNVGEISERCQRTVGAMSARCWRDVGAMLARCWRNVGAMLARCWRDVGAMSARCWRDVGAMLAQYQRKERQRRSTSKPRVAQRTLGTRSQDKRNPNRGSTPRYGIAL